MKVLSNLRILFMLIAATFMITSCADDLGDGGGGGGTTTPLTMSISTTSDVTVALGGTFSVNLVATAGDDALRAVEVFEDGISIAEFSRISYNGDVAAANPRLLFNDEKTSFDYNVVVTAHTDEVGTRSYTFVVSDDLGGSDSRSVEITTVGIPPALALNGSSTLELDAGGLTNVSLSAVKGSGDFVSIGVAIDGVVDNFDDLAFAGVDCTSNPHLLGGDLAQGFDATPLTFRAPANDGSYVYTITLTDEFGLESNVEFTVVVDTSIPLEQINGVLFNAEGPGGTGGCDLDNGMSTGSSDDTAEIRDQGFTGTGDWAQEIAPANDALLYKLTPGEDGVSESFTFASIDSKETLAGLVGSGLGVASSGTVLVGDVYLVVRGGVNYAFEVTEVNVVAADNSDNYVLNIVK